MRYSNSREEALEIVETLVKRFGDRKDLLKNEDCHEARTLRDFIDPLLKAFGWDVDNENGVAESYREVIQQDRVVIGGAKRVPKYSFGGSGAKRLFFLDVQTPTTSIKDNAELAYWIRRYGWSAKTRISVLTDFEELAVYDCINKPKPTDKASAGRIRYIVYSDYAKEFDFLWDTFSKECVLKGSLDKYTKNDKDKRRTNSVDKDFLDSLDKWRIELAKSIARRNNDITEDELNFVVQHTIGRVVFLRIAEEKSVEGHAGLRETIRNGNYYQNLLHLFRLADQKYRSALFDFRKDKVSSGITIDNETVSSIVSALYYPPCPYEFSVMSVEILGSAYERFIGKQILLSSGGCATIEKRPEVRKAVGAYYTPQLIVDYIVKYTVGSLVQNKTPKEVSNIKIVDPACGGGCFLIGAYQYLLQWHREYYLNNELKTTHHERKRYEKTSVLTPSGELTTGEKLRILLNNIYGVDWDSNAVEVTKLSLLLKWLEGETAQPIETQAHHSHDSILRALGANIKSGNSLIDMDWGKEFEHCEKRKVKPFSWEKAFPNVFDRCVVSNEKANSKQRNKRDKQTEKDGEQPMEPYLVGKPPIESDERKLGFDIVISNPPYAKVAEKRMLAYLSQKYEHQDYQRDLYLLFLERYKSLLAQGGKLGVIIPNTWMLSINFRSIRRYLMNDYSWERILHICQHIFKAAVDTHVLVFERNSGAMNSNVPIDTYDNGEIRLHQVFSQQKLPANGDVINVLSNDDEKALFAKIKAVSLPLCEICQVYNGVKPFEKGKGRPPQTAETIKTKPYVVEDLPKPEGEHWMPLLRGRLIQRYTSIWDNNSWINYGRWLAAPRNIAIFRSKEKIVVRQTADSIIATLIGPNIVCRNNLHVVLSDQINLRFLLGIVNSKVANFYYYQLNPEKGEALAEVKKQHVVQLPVPATASEKQQIEIISNVDQLLLLYKELHSTTAPSQVQQVKLKIEYCENQINEVVHELYALTSQEIRVIERTNRFN